MQVAARLVQEGKRRKEIDQKEANGIREVSVEELSKRISDLEQMIGDKQQTIDTLLDEIKDKQKTIDLLVSGNEVMKSEIAQLKESRPNGAPNGHYPYMRTESGSLKEWLREKDALIETNHILETKIKGLMEELQKYQEKDKGVPDSVLQQREKKELVAKLNEFDFLFRVDANAYRSADLQPIDKIDKILEAVKSAMANYFNFVALSIKYDSIQTGNFKGCNLNTAELYEEALLETPYHKDWPFFILSRLSNRPFRRSTGGSGYFNISPTPKRVTYVCLSNLRKFYK
eukprot:Phypoly_transcript_04949.p1 GENE.Phypoly_transcript_04949~~Phypoly_transcript_04949.p1  ORF type:complete len:287 (+),score=37.05 Phypoly_transcript_04949:84-944(+)